MDTEKFLRQNVVQAVPVSDDLYSKHRTTIIDLAQNHYHKHRTTVIDLYSKHRTTVIDLARNHCHRLAQIHYHRLV